MKIEVLTRRPNVRTLQHVGRKPARCKVLQADQDGIVSESLRR